MNKLAQARLNQIEKKKKELLGVTQNTHLSQVERAKAVNELRALLDEEDNLNSGTHWLAQQTTTSNRIMYQAVQNALRKVQS